MILSKSAVQAALIPPPSVFGGTGASEAWNRPADPPDVGPAAARAAGVVAIRKRSMSGDTGVAAFPAVEGRHAVSIVLRRANVCISTSSRILHDGIATPGLIVATGPTDSLNCQFKGPYDMLHIKVADGLVAEAARSLSDAAAFHGEARIFQDPIVDRLAHALIASGDAESRYGPLHDDCIGVAIVTRVIAGQDSPRGERGARASALVKWRLKRTLDFIEANLAEPIGLTEIAGASGLTRMHFAAQFRAATGLRPHEYLLRRRVERAQEMLLAPRAAVVDVALDVGFQTQAHFTSVFRRFVGEPPHAWRQGQNRAA